MTAELVAGGSRWIALAHGKTGVHAAVDGQKPHPLSVRGELNSESLAAALNTFTADGVVTKVILIGTRADGTPGWDEIDPDAFVKGTPHEVHFLSEAQAYGLAPIEKRPVAWIILATANSNGEVKGSARWWVQDADDVVTCVNVHHLGIDHGQIFTFPGNTLADSPVFVAGIVGSLVSHHSDVARVYIWSQDGLTGHWGYEKSTAQTERVTLWRALRLPQAFTARGGDIVVIDEAQSVLRVASKHGVPHDDSLRKEKD